MRFKIGEFRVLVKFLGSPGVNRSVLEKESKPEKTDGGMEEPCGPHIWTALIS